MGGDPHGQEGQGRPEGLLRCDVRIGWVLAGCRAAWAGDVRYVDTTLPASEVVRLLRPMVRAQAAENVHAEHYRAKLAFGLPK